MDKKDLEAIAQIVNSAIEGSNGILRQEIKQEIREEVRQEIRQSNEDLRKEIRQLDERLTKEMNALEEKISDRMFLFEQEYGKKIDAIFDVAIMQKDGVQKMYKDQEKFIIQVDNLDTKVFDLDQRVFKLEHS